MDTMTPNLPGIGDNSGDPNPIPMDDPSVVKIGETDYAKLLDVALLRDQLLLDHKAIFDRRDSLLAAAVRFHDTCPERPENDEACGRAQDFYGQFQKLIASAKATHEKHKKPFFEAGKLIDTLFNAETIRRLEPAMTLINGKITKFHQWKADETRKAAEAEAERLQAEADALAAAAAATPNAQVADTVMERAVEVAERAEQAGKVATASTADLSRTRGSYGSVGSLRDNWRWEIDENAGGLMELVKAVADGKVPLHYLTTNDTMITANVKPKTGVRTIPGLRIWNDQKTGIR